MKHILIDLITGRKFSLLLFLFALSVFVLVNFISSQFFFRLDVTEEKLYTLSKGSKKIIKELEKPTSLKLYFSADNTKIPQSYRNYGKRVEELLREYVALNPQILSLEVFDPKPDSDEEQAARIDGISGVDVDGSSYRFYLGLSIAQGDQKEALPFFDIRSQQSLEYDITRRIYKIDDTQKLKIGIMSTFVLEGIPFQPNRRWGFYEELSKFYKVERFLPTHEIPEDIDILIALHPKELTPNRFSDNQELRKDIEYAIDQFLLKKGKVIVIVDPFMRSDDKSLPGTQKFLSASDAPILFNHWGLVYDASSVIAEPQKSFVVRTNTGNTPYFLWHNFNESSFAKNIPALESLENVLFAEPGGFHHQGTNLEFQPLITSGINTGVYPNRLIFNRNPSQINKDIALSKEQYFFAGLLKGKFTSAFKKRIELDKKVEFKNKHLAEGEGVAMVITDADWLHDSFSVRKFQVLNQIITQPLNDNLGLFLNLVEYMSGVDKLYAIRSRGKFSREFIKIVELERKAQREYKKVETALQNELNTIRKQLKDLQPKDGKVAITKAQLQQIKDFKQQEKQTFVKLREIRKLLRQDIEALKSLLKVLNLTLVPILVLLVGIFVFRQRYYTKKKTL